MTDLAEPYDEKRDRERERARELLKEMQSGQEAPEVIHQYDVAQDKWERVDKVQVAVLKAAIECRAIRYEQVLRDEGLVGLVALLEREEAGR